MAITHFEYKPHHVKRVVCTKGSFQRPKIACRYEQYSSIEHIFGLNKLCMLLYNCACAEEVDLSMCSYYLVQQLPPFLHAQCLLKSARTMVILSQIQPNGELPFLNSQTPHNFFLEQTKVSFYKTCKFGV